MRRRVFFFQAEDGIRDIGVTGVQTCALPISHLRQRPARARRSPLRRLAAMVSQMAGSTPVVAVQAQPGATTAKPPRPLGDRKSVVEGKRVDLGGRRILKKIKASGILILPSGL